MATATITLFHGGLRSNAILPYNLQSALHFLEHSMGAKNLWYKFSVAPQMRSRLALIAVERSVVFPRELMLMDPRLVPSQFEDCSHLPVGMYRGKFTLGFSNATWRPDFNSRNEPIATHPDWDSIGCVATLQIQALSAL